MADTAVSRYRGSVSGCSSTLHGQYYLFNRMRVALYEYFDFQIFSSLSKFMCKCVVTRRLKATFLEGDGHFFVFVCLCVPTFMSPYVRIIFPVVLYT